MSPIRRYALSVMWVGGWAFVFAVYPEVICRLARLEQNAKRVRQIKMLGILEFVLVWLSSIFVAVSGR